MRRVAVVLNVLPARRVGETVLVRLAQALHEREHSVFLGGVVGGGLEARLVRGECRRGCR
jgi:hypothetical protein